MRRLLIGMFLILASFLACGTPSTGTFTPSPLSPSQPSIINSEFTTSVEYGILGLAQTYADAGVTYVKLQDAYVVWGNIEPEIGRFEWGPLDAVVLEYQQAGFTGIQMDITALSPWASKSPPTLGNTGDTFPAEEYLDDYANYVTAVVERYDADGFDDMPGLLFPVNDYGVEREFTGFWPGTAVEYIQLLRIAYPAIKAANPQAKVLLVALLMTDIFDGNPSATEIERRMAIDIDYMRKSVPDIRTILAACDAYDMIDFHSLADYAEIPPTVQWIRSELEANGCGERPIWIGDAFPMSLLIGFGGLVPPTPFAPVTSETRDAIVHLLTAVADPNDADHSTSQAWLYRETAIGLVRKMIVSAGEGIVGVNIGNMEDWKTGVPGIDRVTVPMLGASMFFGLSDTTITNQRPGGALPFWGQDWSRARRAGDLRPAWFALNLFTDKLHGYTSVEKLAQQANIWAYHFTRPLGDVWVIWHDDGQLYLPGENPPSIEVEIPFTSDAAIVTFTLTDTQSISPETRIVNVIENKLTLQISSPPVFIEADQ